MSPDAAKALVSRYFERLFNQRDLTVCDALLAPDYVDHDAPKGTPPGPTSIQAFAARFLADYPDLGITVEDILAEGDRVAVRLIWRGTHHKTGVKLHQMGVVILRINAAGQLAERWSAIRPLPQAGET